MAFCGSPQMIDWWSRKTVEAHLQYPTGDSLPSIYLPASILASGYERSTRRSSLSVAPLARPWLSMSMDVRTEMQASTRSFWFGIEGKTDPGKAWLVKALVIKLRERRRAVGMNGVAQEKGANRVSSMVWDFSRGCLPARQASPANGSLSRACCYFHGPAPSI